MSVKAEKAYCPHCEAETLVHEERLYDGLVVRGLRRCCAFCRAELEPVAGVAKPASAGRSAGPDKGVSPRGLAALWGDEAADSDHQPAAVRGFLQDNPAAEAFCKNCRHSFLTPFCCQCVLHRKEVDPMHDCPDFSPKSEGPVSL